MLLSRSTFHARIPGWRPEIPAGRRLPAGVILLPLPVMMLVLLLLFPSLPVQGQTPGPTPGGVPGEELSEPEEKTPLDEAERMVGVAGETMGRVRERLRGQVVTLGGGLVNTTLNLTRDRKFANATTPRANMTDNGRLDLLFTYQTEENYLAELPLRVGHFRLGYNTVFKWISFDLERQTVRDATAGEDLGTNASGTMVGVAPTLFMLIGPLYPNKAIYWKAGFGAGGGVIRYDGDVLFSNAVSIQTSRETVSGRADRLYVFIHTFWNLEWENWLLAFQNFDLRGSTPVGTFVFKQTSISIGYTIHF